MGIKSGRHRISHIISHLSPAPVFPSIRPGRPLMLTNNPPRMDHTGNPSQNRKQDIDQEVCAAAGLEEDREWGQKNCEEVEADVGLLGSEMLVIGLSGGFGRRGRTVLDAGAAIVRELACECDCRCAGSFGALL